MYELRVVAGADHAFFMMFHILLVVTWLGMDIGVFASSFLMRNATYPIKERLMLARLASLLDMGPRASLLLMYPVGAWLCWAGGWGFQHPIGPFGPITQLVLISLVFAVWEVGVWWQYFTHRAILAGTAGGHREYGLKLYRRWDIYGRWVLGGLLILDGLLALFGIGFIEQSWIAWKVLLFGLIVYQGIGIRWAADAFPALIQDIVANGSTPEREAALSRAFVRAYPFVLILWGCIIVISVIGIVK
jgi:hypothetical protein